MKIILSFVLITFFSINICNAQVNFTCKDCEGADHDLYTELDEGKVIVLCWVMPCGTCLGPSLTTYNVVQSYQMSNPEKVYMYLCDDYANTTCTSLNSWATGNNMPNTTRFSNSAIKMTDYGTAGMPKIVVIASNKHTVFYNVNTSVNSSDLQTAIESAINSTSTEIIENEIENNSINLFPNPSKSISYLELNIEKTEQVEISVFDNVGRKVISVNKDQLLKGKNIIEINTKELNSGIYFVKYSNTDFYKTFKLVVSQ